MFEPWNCLLQKYVNDQGRVDYRRWQTSGYRDLWEWLDDLSSVNLTALTPKQQLSLWLNLYNALTIHQVLQRYPIRSILPSVLGIPNWLQFFLFFQRPVYRLQGEGYSLNRIEHGILRSQFQEPRIHFALVCASVGCPLLRNQAYFPDIVFDQLEDDAQRFIRNPNKVMFDPQTETLYCSKIFKWYKADFFNAASSISNYIEPYLQTSLPASPSIHYLPYDWSLNAIDSK
ncbi:DUF547 domain-containing protein [Thermocoleostomius sinensis]|jgi:hypothetical protein|uniref:DUF547 domain-containing protein n=1 Tax=Thermocoleostomius sinensis A174 TaxID=2016057 RepID=A0A9E8Z9U2_9CYAN|nr:DUF547 domain-containing protein [Thermocoleostomius sinensis]WAL59203.1 DUF547 domain-containing protein [Thermocoleostomius sinensis A174]